MTDEKKYSILFLLDTNATILPQSLPDICNDLIKSGNDVHVIYPSSNINEEFDIALRKVPWIHAHKLAIENKFTCAQITVPFQIMDYIKRHDGIDVIHSFGLNLGVLSYLGCIGSKTIVINTPDPILKNNAKEKTTLLKRFAIDNITFIFNRLCKNILFLSEEEKTKSAEHISYKNVKSELINSAENGFSNQLLQNYDRVVSAQSHANEKK